MGTAILNGLLKDALKSVLIWLFAAAGGGALLVWLKAKKPQWGGPFMFGLGAAAIIFSIGLMSVIWQEIPKSDPVTIDNVQTKLRNWLDKFGFSTSLLAPSSDRYFGFDVTARGVRFVVFRPAGGAFDSYVAVTGTVTMSDAGLDKLTAFQSQHVLLLMRMELDRFGVSHIDSIAPVTYVTVISRLPITAQLTEDAFIRAMDNVEGAEKLAAESVISQVTQITGKPPVTQP